MPRPRTVAALLLALLAAAARATTTLELRISASGDDAEEDVASAAVDVISSDLELVLNGSAPQLVGLRFPGMGIPASAAITAAWVQFQADEVQSVATSLTLHGDRSEEAPSFFATNGNVSARPRTTAAVGWTPAPWLVVGAQGLDQRTPSLVSVIQELVNATSWANGDPVSLIFTGTGHRTAVSWDGLPVGAPLLHVAFDPPSNYRPTLAVASPRARATVIGGTTVSFDATALDPESGDVSGSIVWTSDLDGILGVGPSFQRADLSTGVHVLSISASDGQGGVATRTRKLTVFAPSNQLLAAGDIGDCEESGDEATSALLEVLPGRILPLGDLAYPGGSSADFANCFDPSWGPHKARMHPVSGNHEWHQPGAAPYFAYFGAAAGTPGEGWYSFDFRGWHVVALSSDCNEFAQGCAANSPQGLWLEADLAANSKPCTLAFLHHPRFASLSTAATPELVEFWQILYSHGVDVILSGHDHAYERFARMNPGGGAEPSRGLRSFVVGTGGGGLASPVPPIANSQVRQSDTYGLLRLTLEPTSYSWEFVPVAGKTFTDTGSEQCVFGAPVVTITSPAQDASFPPGATVSLRGSASDLEQGSLSSGLAWSSSRDGALGSGASLDVTLSSGSHVLTASVTDETGLTGSAQVSVTVASPSSSGCGLGPELAGVLALLLGAARARARRYGERTRQARAQRSPSRGTPKRSR